MFLRTRATTQVLNSQHWQPRGINFGSDVSNIMIASHDSDSTLHSVHQGRCWKYVLGDVECEQRGICGVVLLYLYWIAVRSGVLNERTTLNSQSCGGCRLWWLVGREV